MNNQIRPGASIRRHSEGAFVDIGLIVHVDSDADSYTWLPYPERKGKRRKHHIPAARTSKISGFPKWSRDEQLTLVTVQLPAIFRMSEKELRALAETGSKANRRNLRRSIAKMEEQWSWISDFVAGRPAIELLSPRRAANAAAQAVKAGKVNHAHRFVRAVRAYVLHGCTKLSLLPRWDLCNELGGTKRARRAEDGTAPVPGRPGNKRRLEITDLPTRALTDTDRRFIAEGWRKYKRKPYSATKAYFLTLVEYYGAETREVRGRLNCSIPDGVIVPSLCQFKYHGPRAKGNKRAHIVNLGERWEERVLKPRTGSAAEGRHAVNQAGQIDSTPDDQTLVHPLDRRRHLLSSYTTMVVEPYTNYIVGLYNGFEKPSTMTSLMAIASAAMPKDELCNTYGITLQEGEWLSLAFRRIEGDQGELKSERGINRLTFADTSAEFVRSYGPQLKGPVESSHQSLHRGVRHMLSGSTQGARIERGEHDPRDDACVTHAEFMRALIARILFKNNEELVPQKLDLEMLQAGVKPTRAAILRFRIDRGYVATEPANIDSIVASCLPTLDASVDNKSIHVIDPREGYRQRIPRLEFKSEELEAAGYFAKSRRHAANGPGLGPIVKIHLNPSDLRFGWVEAGDRLVKVHRSSTDRLAEELFTYTLYDLLCMSDDDELAKAYLHRASLEAEMASALTAHETNVAAKKAKREQAKALTTPAASAKSKNGKRTATSEVLDLKRRQDLGLRDIGDAIELTEIGYFDASYLAR
jgi:hypothetical protein